MNKTVKNAKPMETEVSLAAPPTVMLSPTFAARVNHIAHRKAKEHANKWRDTTMQTLQQMADQGSSQDALSAALASFESSPLDADTDAPGAAKAKRSAAAK